ncbi:hypothetical protein [Tengunoibacter tsumagoiensis]|nr:hypothetical protein [Tengunoibacter tsumagoiensis]
MSISEQMSGLHWKGPDVPSNGARFLQTSLVGRWHLAAIVM